MFAFAESLKRQDIKLISPKEHQPALHHGISTEL